MTRINLIDPALLLDQHLRAEYREMRLLSSNLQRTLDSNQGFQQLKVPKLFTLNDGHVYFFYNKGKYIHQRYVALQQEAAKRGIRLSLPFPLHKWPVELYHDWCPSDDDKQVVIERILQRVTEKQQQEPGWYRYYRQSATSNNSPSLYVKVLGD